MAALKDADLRKELGRFKIDKNTDDEKPDFGFTEALKKQTEDIRLPAKPVEEKKAPLPAKAETSTTNKKKPEQTKETAKPTVSVSRKTDKAPKKLTVQVASVKNVQDADRLIVTLKEKGFQAYMSSATIPGKGTWYRVRVGSYESKTQADQALSRLKEQKFSGIITIY